MASRATTGGSRASRSQRYVVQFAMRTRMPTIPIPITITIPMAITLLICISRLSSYTVTSFSFQPSPSLSFVSTRQLKLKVSHAFTTTADHAHRRISYTAFSSSSSSSSSPSSSSFSPQSSKTKTTLWNTDDKNSNAEAATASTSGSKSRSKSRSGGTSTSTSQATKTVESDGKSSTPTLTPEPKKKEELKTVSARYVDDNGLVITTDEDGTISARPASIAGKSRTVGVDADVDVNVNVNESENVNENENKGKSKTKGKKVREIKGRPMPKSKKFTQVKNMEAKRAKTSGETKGQEKKGDSSQNRERTDDTSASAKKASKKVPIKKEKKRISNMKMKSPVSTKTGTATTTTAKKASTTTRTKKPIMTKRLRKSSTSALKKTTKFLKEEIPKPIISGGSFNVVLTHCTADFDSLASAVGLAKLWSNQHPSLMGQDSDDIDNNENDNGNLERSNVSTSIPSSSEFKSSSMLPTFVVLPRGAHPAVQRFLALHKHLFPIRSLRSLPSDLSGLNRLGLVDAQRRERVGPAEHLISYADRVTIVDHHIEGDSDIPEATDYVVDKVGSVSAMIAEQLMEAGFELSEAEATLLALGIHADTGSLCYDSTTTRDAEALAWVMKQGASQAAIAEHAHSTLSHEQQGVLTNALINTNSTIVHGVTVSTVLLCADGFINGLAAVTQDALELSSSDVYLLAVVYEPKSGRKSKGSKKNKQGDFRLQSKLFTTSEDNSAKENNAVMHAEAWKGGEVALKLKRLRAAFDKKDTDRSGFLDRKEISAALSQSGVIASEDSLANLVEMMDTDGDGRIDFDEFVAFSEKAEIMQKEQEQRTGRKATTMIVIGRVKAGVNMKDVNLNNLFQQYGGGGHAKAASCTIKLDDESEAGETLQGLVDELIETSLMQQQTVGDFMTSPVLSAKPTMNEKQVEDLFIRYDVRALPVVDDNNDVIGLVTYKEVAAAKQRLWNKEQKKIRQEAQAAANRDANGGKGKNKKKGHENDEYVKKQRDRRKLGSALKGWMKQHVQTVEAGRTMAEVEAVLLENDVGCIPVVADGTNQLVGLVTRTDLLRQHRYYPTLHYHNPGFADSIAARKPIIELRKKLKKFDLDE